MSFPDDELHRLKVWIKNNSHEDDDGLSVRGTKRLLERLEAAENLLENGVALTHSEDCDKVEHHDLKCTCDTQERWEAWRRAAGKGE